MTATDEGGDTTSCSFNVTITDVTKPVQPTLADVIVEVQRHPADAYNDYKCKGTITGTTTAVFPITAQGTTVVTWRFDDGNGNVTTANQNVIVKDITPPVKPVLPDLTFASCNGAQVTPPSRPRLTIARAS